MKIESRGFRVSDICPQIPAIDVDGEGVVTLASIDTMSRDQLDALIEALLYVRKRLDALTEAQAEVDLPRKIQDTAGEIWYRVHDNTYSAAPDEHETCIPHFCNAGVAFEAIKEHWGPVNVIEY